MFDNAIHSAAGLRKLNEECNHITSHMRLKYGQNICGTNPKHCYIDPLQAIMLPSKYVIHAVGPIVKWQT